MHQIGQYVNKLTKHLFKHKNPLEYQIFTNWEMIIGKEFVNYTFPLKLTSNKYCKGLLYIEVYSSSLATRLHYMEPIIIEKIAIYFGYKLVEKLKIIQKPLPIFEDALQLSDKNDTTISNPKLIKLLDNIEDKELKNLLFALGCSIINKKG